MNPKPARVPPFPRSRLYAVVVLMCMMSAVSYFDRTIMAIAGPTIMKEFQFSETAMGSVYSSALVSYMLLMTAGGWLADRFGGRIVLTIGGLLTAVFTALTSLCGSIGSFRMVRLLFGASAAPLYPSTSRVAANWVPPASQGLVQAFIMGTSAVGSATSPLLFSFLIGRFGWRIPFWIAAAITVVAFGAWYFIVRDRPPNWVPAERKQVSPRPSWKEMSGSRNLIWLTVGYLCLNYFEYIFFYWIYYYFGQVRHFTASQSAQFTSILFVAMAVMTPIGGWISDALVLRNSAGRKWVAMAGMSLSAVMMYVGVAGVGVAATVALLALALGFASAAEGPYWSTAISLSEHNVGAACGIMNTGGNVGGILAPVLTPLIAEYFGWSGGLYFACFIVLMSAASWLFIHFEPRRP